MYIFMQFLATFQGVLMGKSLLNLVVSLLVLLPTLATAETASDSKLRIVATTSDIGCVTRSIAGEHADVSVICAGDRDAHYLQARPSYIMLARNADLWIRVGMELEIGWEPMVLDGARNVSIREGGPRHLDVSQQVLKLEVPTQRVSRAMGDVHPSGNPHYWMDPFNMRIVAETIANKLIEIDPGNRDSYTANLAAFQLELDQRMFGNKLVERFGGETLWAHELRATFESFLSENSALDDLQGWSGKMRPLAGRKIVTYHKNWSYFANRFGIEIPIELEPKPGIPPSPAHLTRVIDLMNSQSINTILMATIYPRRAADRVAASTDARVLIRAHSVGGTEAADTYFALIDDLVQGLIKFL